MNKKLIPTAVSPDELAEQMRFWTNEGVKFNVENLTLKSFVAPHRIGCELLEYAVHDEHTDEWRWGSVYYAVVDVFGSFYGVSYRTQPEEGVVDDGEMTFTLVKQQESIKVTYDWVEVD